MRTITCLCIALYMSCIAAYSTDYLPNRIIVKFKESGHTLTLSHKRTAVLCATLPAVEALNARYKCNAAEELSSRKNNGTKPRMYALNFPAGSDMKRIIEEYQNTGAFEFVERDAYGEGTGRKVQRSTKKSQKKRADLNLIPDDTNFGTQWSLRNTGTFSLAPAKVGADIRMTDAWTVTQGDSSVIVAILDSGCDFDHPEFSGRTWRNTADTPGNGLDDDGNGFADDVRGWNFAYNNANVNDDYGHGTNVSSIIGMNGNNGRGLAGVDWRCKLMNLKVLDSTNRGLYSWWAAAIAYASDNGARVINMSLGGTTASAAMQSAIAEAIANNSIVVVSMGNDNRENPSYPAATPGAMAVGCTNPDDTRTTSFPWNSAKGSNFGSHISVTAPGNFIYGLDHRNRTVYSSYWSGTSQSAPHVSGLCALLLAQNP
ncbi:MAG: S8 family serine peptidase, partial [Candidatus Kapabacteria bacterium]|nr:S8 family serine peptidase [Candidatus Kapabacteria bacterium]